MSVNENSSSCSVAMVKDNSRTPWPRFHVRSVSWKAETTQETSAELR